ncbi:MAG: flagellar filament capping protein FliD [Candidatus Caenarcaniphilales bacterium]|nr:flagellar filament capping protein FliD [Candidatus Caenarcaniphilales bacterium]
MSVSFLGLNSSFDSNALVSQLVQLETQSRIVPLEQKQRDLRLEQGDLGSLESKVNVLKGALDIADVTEGVNSLISNSGVVSDTDKADIRIFGTATPQNFDLNILRLATETIKQSANYIDSGLTTASSISEANLRGRLEYGTVTINNETITLPDLTETRTVLQTASQLSNGITTSSLLADVNLDGVTSITDGTVTVNGTSASVSGLTDVQSVLDFFTSNFAGVGASLVNGNIELTGITSLGDAADTSDLLAAVGLTTETIDTGTNVAIGSRDLSIPRSTDTLDSMGITGTLLTINGTDITFDPATDTIDSLIDTINNTSGLNVTAAYDSATGKFSLTNSNIGATSISVSSADSNIVTNFDLTDETLGSTTTVQTILDFFTNNFTGVTASLVNGQVQLDGVNNMGSAGDTSTLLSVLGLNNAFINTGTVVGIQNISTPRETDTLDALGITGTNVSINGHEITFDPAVDTIDDIVRRINNTSATNVKANYDELSGIFKLTNTRTGALTIPITSTDSNIETILGITNETLGDNAEFQISTLNGGQTMVSNNNSVGGIIDGVTLSLKETTTDPIRVSIIEDSSQYKSRIDAVLNEVNSIISDTRRSDLIVARGLEQGIKRILTSVFDNSNPEAYKSAIEIGLKSNLVNDEFSGYTITTNLFSEALAADPSALNTLFFGKTDSEIPTFSDGSQGLFVQLDEFLATYVSGTDAIFNTLDDTLSRRIRDLDDQIFRAEENISSFEERLIRQYSQLDTLNAELQQQQAAIG